MAGTRRLNDVAASMTPAENPSMISRSRSEICLVNKIGRAPAPVAKPATRLAIDPNHTISVLRANQPIFSPRKSIGHVKKRVMGIQPS
jgi:hypothetical protein